MATLDEMVENAFNDQCTGANPRYPLMSEMKEMYLRLITKDKIPVKSYTAPESPGAVVDSYYLLTFSIGGAILISF